MSLNCGTVFTISSVSSISKSVGIGISCVFVSLVLQIILLFDFFCFVTLPKSNAEVGVRDICSRARAYATRNSAGIGADVGSAILSLFNSGLSVVSVFVSDGTGASTTSSSIGVCMNAFLINSGILMVNNGALVRAITIVVAIYIGTAAKIKIPKTMPAKPCMCACASCHQRMRENILKSNIYFIIAHVAIKYPTVHKVTYLFDL